MKKIRKQNGITLIALVITIIVMLILVGVTITIAVNGGLFNYAKEAADKTDKAIKAENDLADLRDGMSNDELIDKFTSPTE